MSIILSFLAGLVVGIIAARFWWADAVSLWQAERARAAAKLESIFNPSKPPSA